LALLLRISSDSVERQPLTGRPRPTPAATSTANDETVAG
jgi:hypothetical protein